MIKKTFYTCMYFNIYKDKEYDKGQILLTPCHMTDFTTSETCQVVMNVYVQSCRNVVLLLSVNHDSGVLWKF